ncbi:hypothetical protein KM043_017730 [Ampulex compressa]|nr:hypothetical protein KM043_017730 [Ampulex compressa]
MHYHDKFHTFPNGSPTASRRPILVPVTFRSPSDGYRPKDGEVAPSKMAEVRWAHSVLKTTEVAVEVATMSMVLRDKDSREQVLWVDSKGMTDCRVASGVASPEEVLES